MKLAPQSVPYRALQKAAGTAVALFVIVNSGGFGLPLAVGGGAAILLVTFAYEVAYYRRFEYVLTEDTLDISSGVISRREREIPYRRIQNVDVSRGVIQRAIGVAAVDLETAGGSSTEGSIRFVTPDEATRLQREVQRRKSGRARRDDDAEASGTDADEFGPGGDDAFGPDEEVLFAISPGELAMVGALSFDGRLIGLLAFLSSGSFPVLSSFLPETSAAALTATAIVGVAALFIASWLIGAGVAFSNYYGFRLSRAGDELRYERGLFRRYSGSIPTEKIQALRITDNPAKRALGYASLSIETAGYAPGQGSESGNQSAVPIAATDRVYRLAHEVESFGTPEFNRPPKRIRWRYVIRYTLIVGVLTGIAYGVNWYVSPSIPWYGAAALLLAVPPAAHLKWKHRGYWVGEDHLLTRNGFWSRTVAVVPYYRIQNVIDSRTLFQRRWGVATIVADTAGTGSLTGSDAAAVDFEVGEAEALKQTLTERLATAVAARRSDGADSFEWLDGDDGGEDGVDETDGSVGSRTEEGKPAEDEEPPGGEKPAGDERGGVDEGGVGSEDAGDEPDDDVVADAEADDVASEASSEEDLDIPEDGVVRPDFSPSDRDYSEPAERIDTGEYAVDQNPSDADVAHGPGSGEEREADGDAADGDRDIADGDRDGEGETPDDR
ncbi:PH domain-containing protein [Halorubrum ezzemoulense]|uniref:PH domain-containing protein n=1 Tax=Halorubrum ezzemoulense TaxID=337243 RepID=UPI00232E8DCE|nr:PH domain-containing protein [Halorubrum ezzemoulense]MDB9248044.1 PH domain-containing protein [Halorubrum ezzemoulense]MDB9258047.1 PH domain-containing protein [Halorubrum ezzemoulense]MDB9261591.1 PH domain-containing protein [Halorubrum ezzemoulense]MDB9265094.1 PH domain-containing protein [Halorubrum ezzemoulense]MDB9268408.1 PH domain-containing protein [Halorubrum ezzemoulense]